MHHHTGFLGELSARHWIGRQCWKERLSCRHSGTLPWPWSARWSPPGWSRRRPPPPTSSPFCQGPCLQTLSVTPPKPFKDNKILPIRFTWGEWRQKVWGLQECFPVFRMELQAFSGSPPALARTRCIPGPRGDQKAPEFIFEYWVFSRNLIWIWSILKKPIFANLKFDICIPKMWYLQLISKFVRFWFFCLVNDMFMQVVYDSFWCFFCVVLIVGRA